MIPARNTPFATEVPPPAAECRRERQQGRDAGGKAGREQIEALTRFGDLNGVPRAHDPIGSRSRVRRRSLRFVETTENWRGGRHDGA